MTDYVELLNSIFKEKATVHFIGVGGISVSSLALMTKNAGAHVTGSDRTPSDITGRLEANGIKVIYGHYPENVHGVDCVVYTAAVKNDNPELLEASKLNIPTFTRAEYLGWLMLKSKNRIGVAGTHGKSTVTAMLSEIYLTAKKDPTVICGAEIPDINGTYKIGAGDDFVFEACEYCDSFLSFFPTVAVITNIEYDHPDYFKNINVLKKSFEKYISISDFAVFNADDKNSVDVLSKCNKKAYSFGIENKADFTAKNISQASDGSASFDVFGADGRICSLKIHLPGIHNVYNALAAFTAAYTSGVVLDGIIDGLYNYHGIKRRFEYMGETGNGASVFNDYAHHPTEIRALLTAAKTLEKRVVCLFQPHTFSRTASLFYDFVDALSLSDVVIVSDIYAARETNDFGVTSEKLASAIKNGIYGGNIKNSAEYVKNNFGKGDLILIVGAGDIINAGKIILE